MHVEHEIEPEIVAYYVLDNAGNVVDQKFPYPLEEYDVEIDPIMIVRQHETTERGITHTHYQLKWGKEAHISRDSNGKLVHIHFPYGGVTINNIDKKILVNRPNFEKTSEATKQVGSDETYSKKDIDEISN